MSEKCEIVSIGKFDNTLAILTGTGCGEAMNRAVIIIFRLL